MRVAAAALFVATALTACMGSDNGTTQQSRAARDIEALVERIEAIHPDPWHAVSEADFRAAADELAGRIGDLGPNEQLVELMRLTALLGERDGHSGVFPLDPAHERELHFYPIRLYEFSDGFFVVDAFDRPELVGRRLTSVAGRPIEEVVESVEPLVPADNEQSRKARVAQFLVVSEVLEGLGLGGGEFGFEGDEARLEAVSAAEYAAAFEDLFHPMVPQGLPQRPRPPYLARRLDGQWTSRKNGVAYIAYNVTLGDTSDLARLVRRSRGPLVVDLRHNPGGDNGTYAPLLEALGGRDVVALVSRTTFSAAGNFIAQLELAARVTVVGESSGAAPNQYGDPVPVALPSLGLTTQVAAVYWQKSTPDDSRLAIEADVPFELSSKQFFGGRDPVLKIGLRQALR